MNTGPITNQEVRDLLKIGLKSEAALACLERRERRNSRIFTSQKGLTMIDGGCYQGPDGRLLHGSGREVRTEVTEPTPQRAAAGENSRAVTGWTARREADYERALRRYYDTGSAEDHDACLRLFGLWMITSRGERLSIAKLTDGGGEERRKS